MAGCRPGAFVVTGAGNNPVDAAGSDREKSFLKLGKFNQVLDFIKLPALPDRVSESLI